MNARQNVCDQTEQPHETRSNLPKHARHNPWRMTIAKLRLPVYRFIDYFLLTLKYHSIQRKCYLKGLFAKCVWGMAIGYCLTNSFVTWFYWKWLVNDKNKQNLLKMLVYECMLNFNATMVHNVLPALQILKRNLLLQLANSHVFLLASLWLKSLHKELKVKGSITAKYCVY